MQLYPETQGRFSEKRTAEVVLERDKSIA